MINKFFRSKKNNASANAPALETVEEDKPVVEKPEVEETFVPWKDFLKDFHRITIGSIYSTQDNSRSEVDLLIPFNGSGAHNFFIEPKLFELPQLIHIPTEHVRKHNDFREWLWVFCKLVKATHWNCLYQTFRFEHSVPNTQHFVVHPLDLYNMQYPSSKVPQQIKLSNGWLLFADFLTYNLIREEVYREHKFTTNNYYSIGRKTIDESLGEPVGIDILENIFQQKEMIQQKLSMEPSNPLFRKVFTGEDAHALEINHELVFECSPVGGPPRPISEEFIQKITYQGKTSEWYSNWSKDLKHAVEHNPPETANECKFFSELISLMTIDVCHCDEKELKERYATFRLRLNAYEILKRTINQFNL